jgi:hypothetical protein
MQKGRKAYKNSNIGIINGVPMYRGGTLHRMLDGFEVEIKGMQGAESTKSRTTATYIKTGDSSTPKILIYVNDKDDCFVLEFKSMIATRHSKLTKYDGSLPLPEFLHGVYLRLCQIHKKYFNL